MDHAHLGHLCAPKEDMTLSYMTKTKFLMPVHQLRIKEIALLLNLKVTGRTPYRRIIAGQVPANARRIKLTAYIAKLKTKYVHLRSKRSVLVELKNNRGLQMLSVVSKAIKFSDITEWDALILFHKLYSVYNE